LSTRGAPIDQLRHLERPLDRLPPIRAPDSIQVREHEQVLLYGQGRIEVVELRHDAEERASLLGLLRELVAEELELALVGDRLSGQEPHRRRLACAVRSEQPDAGAHRHIEVEPVHGGDVAVALHHAPKTYRQLSHADQLAMHPLSPAARRWATRATVQSQ